MPDRFSSLIAIGRGNAAANPLLFGLAAIAVGAFLIIVGRGNLASRRATEFGIGPGRALFPSERRRYEGHEAVVLGWLRILGGLAAIVVGIVAIVASRWPAA